MASRVLAAVFAMLAIAAAVGAMPLPSPAFALGRSAPTVFAGAPSSAYLFDQIGSLSVNTAGLAGYTSVDWTDFASLYDEVFLDDFDVSVFTNINSVEILAGGVAGFTSAKWNQIGYRVSFSSAGCSGSLLGDLANYDFTGDQITVVETGSSSGYPTALLRFTLASPLQLQAGKYYVSVVAKCSFSTDGQVLVAQSSISQGDLNSFQSNPLGGFGYTCKSITGGPAYRINASPVCTSNVQSFICPSALADRYYWCAQPAFEGFLNCPAGVRCNTGTYSYNPCDIGFSTDTPPLPCSNTYGYQCSSSRPTDYFLCSSTWSGWRPCPAGTSCMNTSGSIFQEGPCT